MLNEWRTNVWLALEFLVVSVVLWYICDYFYASMRTYFAPLGFEYDHCYELTMYDIPETSPEYRPEYAGDSAQAEARYEILRRLKQMPEIEAAAYSNNARPFNGSNSGITMATTASPATPCAASPRPTSPSYTAIAEPTARVPRNLPHSSRRANCCFRTTSSRQVRASLFRRSGS